MKSILFKNAIIILEKETISNGYLVIEGEKIKSFGPMAAVPVIQEDTKVIELNGKETIIPGFIDVHIHGAGGADTMDGTNDALATIASVLPAEGTTSFLATTMTQKSSAIDSALINVTSYCQKENRPGKAEILGIHLEGPFISLKKAGAQPKAEITTPDIRLFRQMQNRAKQLIKLVTLAPEEENGIEFIRYLSENGVISSIGHSDATFMQVDQAVKAGATHVTHLFNGMSGIHHREPGLAGAALLFNQLKVEIIADGIHVRPEIIKLTLQSKGKDGIILVTDAMRAKCLKNGVYNHGGQAVTVKDGKAFLPDGTLAGSILKMRDSVENVMNFTGISLADAVRLASNNPAKQLNVYDRKGSIDIGKDADIVVLDEDLNVKLTFCRGIKAFDNDNIQDAVRVS